MKAIFTCLVFAIVCFGITETLSAQVNVQDSLALVDLYNKTNGPGWKNNTNWLTGAPVSTWNGVRVVDGRVSTLRLFNNKLKGDIPSSLGNLSKLIDLDLSTNDLRHNIPSSLGKLSDLRQLQLQHNVLRHAIPPSLGNLTNLRYLELNDNQLSDSIPSALLHLPYLIFLYLENNQFTFAGMEAILQQYPFTSYAPQAIIPLIKNGKILSVNAGGTLSNNTYRWYKNGVLTATKTGDSAFKTTGAGNYNVLVTNAIVTGLTLYSDTITTTSFAESENMIGNANAANTFVYPNPVHNTINVNLYKPANETTSVILYNIQGKAVMQRQLVTGSLTQCYATNNLAAGNYVLVILENGKNIHEEVLIIER